MDVEMSAGQKIGIVITFAMGLVIVWVIANFYHPRGRK